MADYSGRLVTVMMYFFGTHMLNGDHILRIDLWHTEDLARVYFVDDEPLVLDRDATLEARQFAEDGRRMLRVEDETALYQLEQTKSWLAEKKNAVES